MGTARSKPTGSWVRHPEVSPQCRRVLEYMEPGRTLTNMVALSGLGVGSLSSRIAELRRAGIVIEDDWAEDHFGRRYKRYWLKDRMNGKTQR